MHFILTDDEQGALTVLTDAVKEVVPGAKLHGFTNPLEALEFMKEIKCDVAFLDIQMREMSGITLARKLKEIYPKVNIVFVTGYSDYAGEAFNLHASGYVHKPVTPAKVEREMENVRYPITWKESGIFVRTFGNFDIYVNGAHVQFGRGKAKEMLAYLVDRKGQSISRKELAAVLFENQPYTRSIQNYLSKIIKELTQGLESVGAERMLRKGFNSYSVDVNEFQCDYYDYEKDNATPEEINRFKGEYMSQYSWAENTLGTLHWQTEEKE